MSFVKKFSHINCLIFQVEPPEVSGGQAQAREGGADVSGGGSGPSLSQLALLLGAGGQLGPGGQQAMVDLPPDVDADDEAMMELAIALSLQDQSGGVGGLNLQGLSFSGAGCYSL